MWYVTVLSYPINNSSYGQQGYFRRDKATYVEEYYVEEIYVKHTYYFYVRAFRPL